jgi:hypothetical protein
MKKGYSCASCDKKVVANVRDPTDRLPRAGQGFSNMLMKMDGDVSKEYYMEDEMAKKEYFRSTGKKKQTNSLTILPMIGQSPRGNK